MTTFPPIKLYRIRAINLPEARTQLPDKDLLGNTVFVCGFFGDLKALPNGNIRSSVEVVLQDKDFKCIYRKLLYRSFFLINVELQPVLPQDVTEFLAQFINNVEIRGYTHADYREQRL